jgi:hypothetical protein
MGASAQGHSGVRANRAGSESATRASRHVGRPVGRGAERRRQIRSSVEWAERELVRTVRVGSGSVRRVSRGPPSVDAVGPRRTGTDDACSIARRGTDECAQAKRAQESPTLQVSRLVPAAANPRPKEVGSDAGPATSPSGDASSSVGRRVVRVTSAADVSSESGAAYGCKRAQGLLEAGMRPSHAGRRTAAGP